MANPIPKEEFSMILEGLCQSATCETAFDMLTESLLIKKLKLTPLQYAQVLSAIIPSIDDPKNSYHAVLTAGQLISGSRDFAEGIINADIPPPKTHHKKVKQEDSDVINSLLSAVFRNISHKSVTPDNVYFCFILLANVVHEYGVDSNPMLIRAVNRSMNVIGQLRRQPADIDPRLMKLAHRVFLSHKEQQKDKNFVRKVMLSHESILPVCVAIISVIYSPPESRFLYVGLALLLIGVTAFRKRGDIQNAYKRNSFIYSPITNLRHQQEEEEKNGSTQTISSKHYAAPVIEPPS